MRRFSFVPIAVFAASIMLGAPPTAQAYLSPYDVFGGTMAPSTDPSVNAPSQIPAKQQPLLIPDPNYVDIRSVAPPTQREAADRVAAQQQGSAEVREKEQSILWPKPAPLAQADSAHAAAPEEERTPSLLTPEGEYERRIQRMKNAAEGGVIIRSGGSSERALHSGAPIVVDTGPATMAALIIAFLSLFLTLLRVRTHNRPRPSLA